MGSTKRWWLGVAAAALAVVPAGAQQFVSDSYTFLKAVRDRDGDKATELLDKSNNNLVLLRDGTTGETALHLVVKRRDSTWMAFMIGRGAKLDARDNAGMTPLADAAQLGWPEGAQLLLDQGASVDLADNRGETPLILATQARSVGVVKLLLDHGADPRAPDNVAGLSALDYATRDGRSPAVLKVLQDAKPVVKKRVSGPGING